MELSDVPQISQNYYGTFRCASNKSQNYCGMFRHCVNISQKQRATLVYRQVWLVLTMNKIRFGLVTQVLTYNSQIAM